MYIYADILQGTILFCRHNLKYLQYDQSSIKLMIKWRNIPEHYEFMFSKINFLHAYLNAYQLYLQCPVDIIYISN